MADDDLEELLEPGATTFDDVVAETVGEDLARQGWDGDAGALALEDVAKVLKVRVTAADAALAQLEGGDVCATEDLVVGVHVTAHAMRSWVADLYMALFVSLFCSLYLSVFTYLVISGSCTGRKKEGEKGSPQSLRSSLEDRRSRQSSAGAYRAWIAEWVGGIVSQAHRGPSCPGRTPCWRCYRDSFKLVAVVDTED